MLPNIMSRRREDILQWKGNAVWEEGGRESSCESLSEDSFEDNEDGEEVNSLENMLWPTELLHNSNMYNRHTIPRKHKGKKSTLEPAQHVKGGAMEPLEGANGSSKGGGRGVWREEEVSKWEEGEVVSGSVQVVRGRVEVAKRRSKRV